MKMKIKISETGWRVWGGSAWDGQVFGGSVMFRWGFVYFLVKLYQKVLEKRYDALLIYSEGLMTLSEIGSVLWRVGAMGGRKPVQGIFEVQSCNV